MAKCEVIEKTKIFEPVTLQITLESQEEVNALYCVAVASSCAVLQLAKGMRKISCDVDDWQDVSEQIYNTIKGFV